MQKNVTNTFFTKLVGCTFCNEGPNTQNRQDIIADLYRRGMLQYGQELILRQEPFNRYDDHAMAVFGPDGRQLGYLAKETARPVFNSIDSGKHYSAYVQSVNGGSGYNYGMTIRIEEYTATEERPVVPPKPVYSETQARFDYLMALGEYEEQTFDAESFAMLAKPAQYGLADAQFLYALCLDNGQGTAQDETAAAVWYEKSAQNGNQHAQCNLAMDYYTGTGVPQDFGRAVYWAKKSAAQGDDNGMVILGRMYEKGEGTEQDDRKSFELYLRAAELGNTDGAYNAGICYLIGRGVDRDPREAAKWNRKAAEAGHPNAQFNLANQYLMGEGVPNNYEEALNWIARAAMNGHPKAVRMLKQWGYT